MTTVYVSSKRIQLNPSMSIGKGGEAEVYDIGTGLALKLFKPPDHPDYEGLPNEQKGADERIRLHQSKLRQFPKNLPSNVISPIDLVTDRNGYVIRGYTMRFLHGAEVLKRYSEQIFRQSVENNRVIEIFRNLHTIVKGIHSQRVVIGDFNDLNVLVMGNETYLVDADSMQFDNFYCRVFTARFVDPLICNPKLTSLDLVKPHNMLSDWYAFTVMLMQSLLFVDPYGGVYQPKDKQKRIPHGARPLQRITVFNKEVIYPKPALPYRLLSDEILEYFKLVFEKDKRQEFPQNILENLRWVKCSRCGTEHARNACPNCAHPIPQTVKEKIIVRGKVTATRFFQTTGQILFATYQGGQLKWLYKEGEYLFRENKSKVKEVPSGASYRYRIQGDNTIVAGSDGVLSVSDNLHISVETFGTLPVFDATEDTVFWIMGGNLMKTTNLGYEQVGSVLQNQTLFWTGENFGFGFSRAGGLNFAFTFDTKRKGINDSVKLPKLLGQLIDSTCFFAKDRVWFLISLKEGPTVYNHCVVIKSTGEIEATAKAEEGEDSWLGSLRGKCAARNFLLAITSEGIVRVETSNGQIAQVRSFPDTEPFVSTADHLFPALGGIYVVSRKEITLLKIS